MDRITEAYNGEMGEDLRIASRDRIHWICANVVNNKVLDVGCSQGICDILLGREGFQVLGVDCDPEAIEFAQKSLANETEIVQSKVRFVLGTVPGYDLGDEHFDTIILSEILEHLIHPEQMIRFVKTILNPDGKLIITVPYGVNPYPDHKRTYYLTRILDLFIKDFRVETVRYFHTKQGCWIGLVNSLSDDPGISPELFRKAIEEGEESFEILDQARFTLLDSTTEQRNKWNDERENYKTKIEEFQNKLNEQRDQLKAQAQAKYDEYQKTIADLKEQARLKNEESQNKLNEQRDQLKAQAQAKYDEYQKTIADLKEQTRLKNEDYQQKFAELREQISANQEKYVTAKGWNDEKLQKIEEQNGIIKGMTAEISSSKETIGEMQEINENNQIRIKNLEILLADAKKQINELKTMLLNKNLEFKKMEKDFINFQFDNAIRVQKLQEEKNQNITKLQKEKDDIAKKKDDLIRKNNDLRNKSQILEQNNKTMQQDIKSLKAKEVPDVYFYMSSSRVGRMMAKVFNTYHKIRTK